MKVVDLYFHQVLTLTEAANFFSTVLGDEEEEGESENETISSVSSLNISTILMSTTASPRSTAAASSRLPSKVSDSFSDSAATIADNNFILTKKKIFVLGVVYEEQHEEFHKHMVVVRIKRLDLKQQPTYRVCLILFVLKEGSIFREFLVFMLNLMILQVL